MKPKKKKHITQKSPTEAYIELRKYFSLSYITSSPNDANITYQGFDISELGSKPIAEVVLYRDEPVQVILKDEARKPLPSDFFYGDF